MDFTQRHSCLVDSAIMALLLGAYYAWPLLMPGYEYHGGDPTLLSYPNRMLLREGFMQGVIPLWNPYAGCGVPALAEYQGAFLYPFNWLAVLLFDPMYGSRLTLFLHYMIQAIGMYGLVRFGLRLDRPVAIFAGIAQGASAWNAAHVEQFMIVQAASWAPAILGAWLCFLRSPAWKGIAATAVLLSLAIYAGHSQYWLYTLDVMLLLALIDPFCSIRNPWKDVLKRRLLRLGGLAAVGAIAFGLSAAQLLPTLELVKHSERQIDPPQYSVHSSFPPEYLKHYVAPELLPKWDQVDDPFRNPVEMTVFIGRITILLAIAGLIIGFRNRITITLAVWAAVALVLSFGHYLLPVADESGEIQSGVLFRIASAVLPGWQGLRVPARLTFIANIALIALAAQGLQWFLAKQRAWGQARVGVLTAAGFAVVVLFEQFFASLTLPLRHSAPYVEPDPQTSLPAFFNDRPGTYRVFRLIDGVDIRRYDPSAHAARIATLEPNTGIYCHVGTVRAYVEGLLPLLRTEDFIRAYWRNFYTPTPDAELLGLMNVRYLASDKPIEGNQWQPVGAVYPAERERRPIAIYENLRFRPRVYPAADVASLDPRALEGDYVVLGTPSPPAQSARPIEPLPISPPANITQSDMNTLIVDSPFNTTEWLLSGSAYPGWVVKSSRTSAPLKPSNAMQMSFSAPAGIPFSLHFEPFSFRLGLFLSLSTAAGLLALLGLTIGRSKP